MGDEYMRECLAIDAERRLESENVLERLAALFTEQGTPTYIRSDNGAEIKAKAVREWLGRLDVKTLFIEPGSPWENGGAGRRWRRSCRESPCPCRSPALASD